MSVSVHMNGRKRSDMKKPLSDHQERKSKNEGREVAKHSDSAIDDNLTHMNVVFLQDKNRFRAIRKKLEAINEKRLSNGQRKLRKDANIMMTGTLQLSDESLEALGWRFSENGEKLSSDKQTEQVLQNVKVVYADMLRSVKSQPDIYGDIFSATLHFDETSPHVDFMSDVLDVDKPNQTARDFLNGREAKRGEKMRKMQDNIMTKSQLKSADIEKYDLTRGLSNKERVDRVRTVKRDEKKLDNREAVLDIKEQQVDKKLEEASKTSQEANMRLLEAKERERANEAHEKSLEHRERDVTFREKVSERLQEFYAKIEELAKSVDTSFAAMRKFKDVKNVIEKYNPLTDENVTAMLDEAAPKLNDIDLSFADDLKRNDEGLSM